MNIFLMAAITVTIAVIVSAVWFLLRKSNAE